MKDLPAELHACRPVEMSLRPRSSAQDRLARVARREVGALRDLAGGHGAEAACAWSTPLTLIASKSTLLGGPPRRLRRQLRRGPREPPCRQAALGHGSGHRDALSVSRPPPRSGAVQGGHLVRPRLAANDSWGPDGEVRARELLARLAEVVQPLPDRPVLAAGAAAARRPRGCRRRPGRRRSRRCRSALSDVQGRVTDRSVPTPVSGFSTSSWARSRPSLSAATVTTRPTPRPSPSAVRKVRPLRRRSSEAM